MIVRPDDEDRPALVVGIGGDVNEIAIVMLAQIERPDRAERFVQRRSDRRPVDQVGGMPDDDPRLRKIRREGHVVILAVLEDGRIWPVARDDSIAVHAVAQVGRALPLPAALPARCGLCLGMKLVQLRGASARRRGRGGAGKYGLEHVAPCE